VDGAQRLVMKGRYTQKQIENVLRKYIGTCNCAILEVVVLMRGPVEYVTCKICKSPDTLLGKENRLYFMTCESCGSSKLQYPRVSLDTDGRCRTFGIGDQSGLPGSNREENQGCLERSEVWDCIHAARRFLYYMHAIRHLYLEIIVISPRGVAPTLHEPL
jgi:hypothetical protein